MDRERFSLLLLDPGEIYFEDFSAVLVTPDSTIKTIESKKSVGRLKLCSKSLVFEPKDVIRPLIKIPLKDCNIIEEWKGSSKFISNKDVLRIECSQYIEMVERNIIAPYKFRDNGKFIIALNYAKVIYCLPQICQLKRASTLPAIEQADMIATIVHSRHARIHFDPLWLDLYESVEFETQANKISPLVVNPGRVVLSTSRLYFQPYNNVEQYPVIKININSIQRIFKRRFLLRHIGLEIYYSDESNKEVHIYLSLTNQNERDDLHNRLINHSKIQLSENNQDVMTLQWQNGVISNFEYLLYINSLGDRSKNDLTQYPIFPWIILNYDLETLDLKDPKIYRDLSMPMGALNESRLKKLTERYEEMPDPKFMYGSHYSTPGFVLFYLVRLYPNYMLCLQNGRFDHPDRMFNSYAHLCRNSLNDMSDFKELIPEFYDIEQGGAFLVNNLGINFGTRHTGVKVGDVELPTWAESPKHFIRCLRDALESDYVSEHLHEWIDLIFGYKQRGEEAVKAKNLYYYLCYEGNVDLDSISDLNKRHTLEVQIMEFGQIPKQVFKVPHPKKRTSSLLLLSPTTPEDEQWDVSKWKNLKSIKLRASFNTHKDMVSSVFIDKDCKSIVSAGHDSKIKVFSIRQNRQIRSASIGNMPLSCCIKLPDFNIIIIGTFGNEIILYDLDFGRITQTVVGHDDAITTLKWATKLDLLFSGSGDCTVCLWKGSTKNGTTTIEHILHHFDHSSHVTSLSLDSENEHLAVGTEDGEIYIWQMSDYSLLKKYVAHAGKITSMDYSPDNHKLITCSLDRTFQVLDLYTGMSLYKKTVESPLRCLKWDGILLLLGSDDGILYIWDIIEVKLLYNIQAHEGSVLSIDISSDKKQIVTGGSDCTVKIWNPI